MASLPAPRFAGGMLANLNPAVLILPAIGVAVYFLLRAARKHAIQTRDRLVAYAQANGLTVTEQTVLGFPSVQSLEGEQAGRRVRLWAYTKGSGKSRTHWVAIAVQPRGTGGLEFDFMPQGIISKVMELFGSKEIQVGDAAFDAAWFVRTNRPDFLAAALVPAIRQRLMAAKADGLRGGFKLEAGSVEYSEQGSIGTAGLVERLAGHLPLLHDLADVAEVCDATGAR